jgi:hypothetical protein
MNKAFSNCSKEDEIKHFITAEIAKATQADATLKHLFNHN